MPRVYEEEGQTPSEAAVRCRLSSRGHPLEQQIRRGIPDSEIREVILRGNRKRFQERKSQSVQYKWECWNRLFRVAFYLKPCVILLKTVMYR